MKNIKEVRKKLKKRDTSCNVHNSKFQNREKQAGKYTEYQMTQCLGKQEKIYICFMPQFYNIQYGKCIFPTNFITDYENWYEDN